MEVESSDSDDFSDRSNLLSDKQNHHKKPPKSQTPMKLKISELENVNQMNESDNSSSNEMACSNGVLKTQFPIDQKLQQNNKIGTVPKNLTLK